MLSLSFIWTLMFRLKQSLSNCRANNSILNISIYQKTGTMKTESNEEQPKTENHKSGSHSSHMWMMVICCALPLLSLLVFGALETNFSFTEILLLAGIGLSALYFLKSRKRNTQQPDPAVVCVEEKIDSAVETNEFHTDKTPLMPEIQNIKKNNPYNQSN